MDTITFKEIINLIHPDKNKTIVNAGEKITRALKFRDKPEELFKLGVRWGVIKRKEVTPVVWSTGAAPHIPPKPRRSVIRDFRIGDYVYVSTKDRNVKVTKVTPKRVYFMFDGIETFTTKKNVRFV